jgi:hypothetical protein
LGEVRDQRTYHVTLPAPWLESDGNSDG